MPKPQHKFPNGGTLITQIINISPPPHISYHTNTCPLPSFSLTSSSHFYRFFSLLMRNGDDRKSLSSSSPLDCEVGLGLKMQLPPYSCDSGGVGVGQFLNGSSNPPHFYDLSNGALLQRSLDNAAASRAYGGGMMPVCGKALFTSAQLQELERQKMIHKYIMASIPVPPQLLLSTSTPTPSQCNTSSGGVELRYSTNGSDPEPWRCKRTDGKKWRCSRDVAPEQKYCERHAHKNRPRSRKHVEISPHKPSALPSPRSTSQFPYDQSRCIEWLMRGGNSDPSKQQWEYNKNDNNNNNNNASVYHPQFSDESATAQTRLFIDAISSNKEEAEKKQWQPSLSLSMCDEKGDLGIGMMVKNQWVNPVSWMNSGGPLGEALCLGNASTTSNLTYPRSYGYSNSNTNSSSEDGSHALNFIG
ncbi:growth-regulating factor 8-like [Salvia splendens]|nr:growth-regulating factor 8-like [Salvia splendens]